MVGSIRRLLHSLLQNIKYCCWQDPQDYSQESRQHELVQATLRTMREKRAEVGIGEGTQAMVKIKEAVTICL